LQNCLILHDAQTRQWLWFQDPIQVYVAHTLDAVVPTLDAVEQAVQRQGLYAAGFVAYEAASAFDPALRTHAPDMAPDGFPLAWFGLYREPLRQPLPPPTEAEYGAIAWQRSIPKSAYRAALDRIKHHIRQGETYQVNYSFRLQAEVQADPWELFRHLIRAQGDGYGAFVQTPDWAICSASPELFFERDGQELRSRPMKGTAPRGLQQADDQAQAQALRQSVKNNAENLMIVDMVRNDFGQIADLGTVSVPELFAVEKYPTLWQLTSTVRCTSSATLAETFRALYPPASITGAPKARTMGIITELETTPRRIYTGTIGFLTPDGRSQFNVAIRTVLIHRPSQQATYGVGGGVVWDSEQQSEFQECATKARVLTHPPPQFDLLETLRWEPNSGYVLLEAHLDRLLNSVAYFAGGGDRRWDGCDRATLQSALLTYAQTLPPRPHKVRLRLPATGQPLLNATAIPPTPQPYQITLAQTPTLSTQPLLYHKTTDRRVYETALAAAGYADVLLWNERGEITESCIGNVVVEREGQWFTPPVASGLLPGTYRGMLLAQGKVQEQVIRCEDLRHCSRLFLVNSVRGMWEVSLVRQREGAIAHPPKPLKTERFERFE